MAQEICFLIVIPTFNSYMKLKRFKKSLYSQTFQNWRVIFIDADSKKDHKDWINSCVDFDKRFLVYEESNDRKGIYPSMSFGAKFAKKNDWTIFLGSDDWFSSINSLSFIANTISHNLQEMNQKLIICGTQFINNNNNLLRLNNVPNLKFTSNNNLAKLIYFGYVPTHQSLCFSQDLLKKLMPYSTKYNLAADADLILKMLSLKEFNIVFLNKILINIEAGGLSSKFLFKRLKEVFLIYINYFKLNFLIPLFLRYLKKILSRIKLLKIFKNFIHTK